MKFNILILIIFTISSPILFGCDQIVDRSLGKTNKIKSNESTLGTKEKPLKSLGSSSKDNIKKKSKEKDSSVTGDLSNDNSEALKRKYDVIGTNKDGPYRSGETNRIRSTK